MMPTIRVEDDVFAGLKQMAEPFIDTPNSVIRRLLEEKGVLTNIMQQPNKNERADRASLTPQQTYESFLLHVLATKFNGHGTKQELTKSVIDLMKSKGFIGEADRQTVSTGETRAENTIAWARNALKDRGLISSLSVRGVWELTKEGLEEGRKLQLPSK